MNHKILCMWQICPQGSNSGCSWSAGAPMPCNTMLYREDNINILKNLCLVWAAGWKQTLNYSVTIIQTGETGASTRSRRILYSQLAGLNDLLTVFITFNPFHFHVFLSDRNEQKNWLKLTCNIYLHKGMIPLSFSHEFAISSAFHLHFVTLSKGTFIFFLHYCSRDEDLSGLQQKSMDSVWCNFLLGYSCSQ